MKMNQFLFFLVSSSMLRSGTSERLVAAGTLTECKTGGSRVCDGAVTKELKKCEWYGQLYCSGDIIIDLYSWKFLKKCADGKMGIYGRSWQEVSEDPRFKDDVRKIRKQLRRRR